MRVKNAMFPLKNVQKKELLKEKSSNTMEKVEKYVFFYRLHSGDGGASFSYASAARNSPKATSDPVLSHILTLHILDLGAFSLGCRFLVMGCLDGKL